MDELGSLWTAGYMLTELAGESAGDLGPHDQNGEELDVTRMAEGRVSSGQMGTASLPFKAREKDCQGWENFILSGISSMERWGCKNPMESRKNQENHTKKKLKERSKPSQTVRNPVPGREPGGGVRDKRSQGTKLPGEGESVQPTNVGKPGLQKFAV